MCAEAILAPSECTLKRLGCALSIHYSIASVTDWVAAARTQCMIQQLQCTLSVRFSSCGALSVHVKTAAARAQYTFLQLGRTLSMIWITKQFFWKASVLTECAWKLLRRHLSVCWSGWGAPKVYATAHSLAHSQSAVKSLIGFCQKILQKPNSDTFKMTLILKIFLKLKKRYTT